MEEKKKLFEVILSPSDMLEKELENVLGGAGSCSIDECQTNTGNCDINKCRVNNSDNNTCPPGMIWDASVCACVPIEG